MVPLVHPWAWGEVFGSYRYSIPISQPICLLVIVAASLAIATNIESRSVTNRTPRPMPMGRGWERGLSRYRNQFVYWLLSLPLPLSQPICLLVIVAASLAIATNIESRSVTNRTPRPLPMGRGWERVSPAIATNFKDHREWEQTIVLLTSL